MGRRQAAFLDRFGRRGSYGVVSLWSSRECELGRVILLEISELSDCGLLTAVEANYRNAHHAPTTIRTIAVMNPARIHYCRAANESSSARRLLDRNGSDPPVSIRIFAIS